MTRYSATLETAGTASSGRIRPLSDRRQRPTSATTDPSVLSTVTIAVATRSIPRNPTRNSSEQSGGRRSLDNPRRGDYDSDRMQRLRYETRDATSRSSPEHWTVTMSGHADPQAAPPQLQEDRRTSSSGSTATAAPSTRWR